MITPAAHGLLHKQATRMAEMRDRQGRERSVESVSRQASKRVPLGTCWRQTFREWGRNTHEHTQRQQQQELFENDRSCSGQPARDVHRCAYLRPGPSRGCTARLRLLPPKMQSSQGGNQVLPLNRRRRCSRGALRGAPHVDYCCSGCFSLLFHVALSRRWLFLLCHHDALGSSLRRCIRASVQGTHPCVSVVDKAHENALGWRRRVWVVVGPNGVVDLAAVHRADPREGKPRTCHEFSVRSIFSKLF